MWFVWWWRRKKTNWGGAWGSLNRREREQRTTTHATSSFRSATFDSVPLGLTWHHGTTPHHVFSRSWFMMLTRESFFPNGGDNYVITVAPELQPQVWLTRCAPHQRQFRNSPTESLAQLVAQPDQVSKGDDDIVGLNVNWVSFYSLLD